MSLIELMIVVSIISVLALVSMPYTQSWLHESQLNNAKSQLSRAFTEAKALALRNPIDAHGTQSNAACVSLKNDTLLVREPNANACSGNIIWQGSWPQGVLLISNNTNLTTIFINNRGRVLINGTPANANLDYTLSKGSINDSGQLY